MLASEALGWQVDLRVGDASDVFGNRSLEVCIQDRHGQPVTDAKIRTRSLSIVVKLPKPNRYK